MEGKLAIDEQEDYGFECWKELSQVKDFGIEKEKYGAIAEDDPFFKFG